MTRGQNGQNGQNPPRPLSAQVRTPRCDQPVHGQKWTKMDKTRFEARRRRTTHSKEIVTSCFLSTFVQFCPRSPRSPTPSADLGERRHNRGSVHSVHSVHTHAGRPSSPSRRTGPVRLTRLALTSGLKRFLSAPGRQHEWGLANAHWLDRAPVRKPCEGPSSPGGCPRGQAWPINLRAAGSAAGPVARTSFRHSHPGSFRTAFLPSPDRWPVTQGWPHSGRSGRFSRAPSLPDKYRWGRRGTAEMPSAQTLQ